MHKEDCQPPLRLTSGLRSLISMASLAFLQMTFSSNARIRAVKMGVFSFAQSMSLWNDSTCSPHGVSFLLFRVSVKCSWTGALIGRCVSPMYSFEQIVQVSEYTANCRSQCVSFNPARQDMQSSRGRPGLLLDCHCSSTNLSWMVQPDGRSADLTSLCFRFGASPYTTLTGRLDFLTILRTCLSTLKKGTFARNCFNIRSSAC